MTQPKKGLEEIIYLLFCYDVELLYNITFLHCKTVLVLWINSLCVQHIFFMSIYFISMNLSNQTRSVLIEILELDLILSTPPKCTKLYYLSDAAEFCRYISSA